MARKRLGRFVCFLFIIPLMLYVGYKILSSSIFTIKIIDIKIDGDISKDEIKRLWNGFLRQNYLYSMPNIFKLNTKSLRRAILSDIRIDSVKIKRYPPDKLIIFIKTRKPFVFIKGGLGVDEKGVIFPIKGTQSLIYLSGFKGKKCGDTIDVSLLFPILSIAKRYPFASLIKEIKIDKKKAFFTLDNILVCIPLEIEGAHKRFKRLDLILKTDLSDIKLIDLSYDDVILSRSIDHSQLPSLVE